MKSYFKSKTMWTNFAMGVVGVVQTTAESAPMEPQTAGIVMAILGAVNMILRSITTGSVSLKGEF